MRAGGFGWLFHGQQRASQQPNSCFRRLTAVSQTGNVFACVAYGLTRLCRRSHTNLCKLRWLTSLARSVAALARLLRHAARAATFLRRDACSRELVGAQAVPGADPCDVLWAARAHYHRKREGHGRALALSARGSPPAAGLGPHVGRGGGERERGGVWPDQHKILSPSLSSLAIVAVAVVARHCHSLRFTVVNLSTIAFADSTMNQYKFDRRFGFETRC